MLRADHRPVRPLLGVLLASALLAGCGGGGTTASSGTTAASSAASGKASTTTTPREAPRMARDKPAAGKGNVQGTVYFDDKPAEGIEARLCETFSRFGSGCGGEVYKAKTDADGIFVIPDVAPKSYQALLVKVFDTDQVQFALSGYVNAASYEVKADQTLFVDPTHLFKEDVRVTAPGASSEAAATGLTITWDAYPSAGSYKVSLYNDDVSKSTGVSGQRVDGTSFKPPTLESGKYRLKVEAFNAKGRKLAENPDHTFTVVG